MADEYINGMRNMVHEGTMSFPMFMYHSGVYYGYKVCCIKNYINLCKLGHPPALFMSEVLGHTAQAGHVLCPMCHDEWDGEMKKAEFDLNKANVVEYIKKYKVIRANLQ